MQSTGNFGDKEGGEKRADELIHSKDTFGEMNYQDQNRSTKK
jgi:hypothetical protein